MHGFLGREAVQQAVQQHFAQKSRQLVAVPYNRVLLHFWHEFRGPYSSIFCYFGTDFKLAVQLHLLQISGHANREIRTTFIDVPFLLFVRFKRRWLSTEKKISCKSLFADYLFC